MGGDHVLKEDEFVAAGAVPSRAEASGEQVAVRAAAVGGLLAALVAAPTSSRPTRETFHVGGGEQAGRAPVPELPAETWHGGAPDAAVRQLLPPPPSRQRQLEAAAAGEPCLLPLLAWQVCAVRAWVGAGRSGVVEAVTGTGKTHVGLEVIARAVASGERSTVLVPTVDLQR